MQSSGHLRETLDKRLFKYSNNISRPAKACGDGVSGRALDSTSTFTDLISNNKNSNLFNSFYSPQTESEVENELLSQTVEFDDTNPGSVSLQTLPVRQKVMIQPLDSNSIDDTYQHTSLGCHLPRTHMCRCGVQCCKSKKVANLSPRLQSLQSFFNRNRHAADIWKTTMLRKARVGSATDFQCGEQNLSTFASGNGEHATAALQAHFLGVEADFLDSKLGDSSRQGYPPSPYKKVSARDLNTFSAVKQYKSANLGHGIQLESVSSTDNPTLEAPDILLVIRETVTKLTNDIIDVDEELSKKNFGPCFSIVEHLRVLPNMLLSLIDHLHYTHQEFELIAVAKSLKELRERLKVGHVVRQYFHIPTRADVIITPYNKDRQLVRLEEECCCVVNLLHPNDPRAQYCPPNHRTIEVLYDEEHGRFETFCHRLNRILASRRCTARLVTTILRHFNGHEVAMTAERAADLLNPNHRPRYEDVRAFVVSGSRAYSKKGRSKA
uniref:ANK_REP_REGION domain-containing protein n=1 Tax=Mesocestoides corti TaxID=53468 RepID=A0A5K3EHB1_MESCO